MPDSLRTEVAHVRRHLRRRYDVGSSTLRQALSLLISESPVTSEGQRGFRVAEVSLDDLDHLNKMRILVETHALRESIAAGDDEWELRSWPPTTG